VTDTIAATADGAIHVATSARTSTKRGNAGYLLRFIALWGVVSLVAVIAEVMTANVSQTLPTVIVASMSAFAFILLAATRTRVRENRRHQLVTSAPTGIDPAWTTEQIFNHLLTKLLGLPGVTTASVMRLDDRIRLVPIAVAGEDLHGLVVKHPLTPVRADEIIAGVSDRPWTLPWPIKFGNAKRNAVAEQEAGRFSAMHASLAVGGDLIGVVSIMGRGGPSNIRRHYDLMNDFSSIVGAILAPILHATRQDETDRAILTEVIAARTFTPVFQPIVRITDGSVVGYEALTRFRDGTPPDKRFATAARVGMGLELELATLERSLEASRNLPPDVWLSINVSPTMVLEGTQLKALIERIARPLVLEVTETTPVDDYEALVARRNEFGPNVRLAVDDAGVGSSGLYHIIMLRPEFVKIDLKLVRDIDQDKTRQALAQGLEQFASQTSMTLIAEGVETQAERDALARLDIPLAQGYLFGRPAPAPLPRPADA
jgi:EAL domain-containing protein (putative c-di-GMP-specific phosphodiesterase class I)